MRASVLHFRYGKPLQSLSGVDTQERPRIGRGLEGLSTTLNLPYLLKMFEWCTGVIESYGAISLEYT